MVSLLNEDSWNTLSKKIGNMMKNILLTARTCSELINPHLFLRSQRIMCSEKAILAKGWKIGAI